MEKINLQVLREVIQDEFEKYPILMFGIGIEQTTMDAINREKQGPVLLEAVTMINSYRGKDLLFRYRSDDFYVYYEIYDLSSNELLKSEKKYRGNGLIGNFDLWFVTIDIVAKRKGQKFEGEATIISSYEYMKNESIFYCTIPLRLSELQKGY